MDYGQPNSLMQNTVCWTFFNGKLVWENFISYVYTYVFRSNLA